MEEDPSIQAPEVMEKGEQRRGDRETRTDTRRGEQACLRPGAPSRPLSPHLSASSPPRLIWALADPITYNKQFRLSLSESLSKLAT